MAEDEIKKIEEERNSLLRELNEIERRRQELINRILELNGVIKYLQEKADKEEK